MGNWELDFWHGRIADAWKALKMPKLSEWRSFHERRRWWVTGTADGTNWIVYEVVYGAHLEAHKGIRFKELARG